MDVRECYLPTEGREALTHPTTWTHLGNMLSGRGQTRKDIDYRIPLMESLE